MIRSSLLKIEQHKKALKLTIFSIEHNKTDFTDLFARFYILWTTRDHGYLIIRNLIS